MKVLYFILFVCFFAFAALAQAQGNDDSFCIDFYQKPSYKVHAGVVCGSIAPGEGAGSKSGNMSVASFKAPSFLQVTLYEGRYWSGKVHVYKKGSQKKISPAVHVGSVRWKHM